MFALSSGTTGAPRAVIASQGARLNRVRLRHQAISRWWSPERPGVFLLTNILGNAGFTQMAIHQLVIGGRSVLLPQFANLGDLVRAIAEWDDAAAGSDVHDSAVWGQFLGGGASRDSNAEADGYSTQDFGLATGVDHLFTPNAMGGVALSWLRAWTQGKDDTSGSSATLDSYQLTFYGTYREDQAFVDGQLGAGWNSFGQKRAIPVLGSVATANYDGQQYLASAKLGYDLPLGDGITATPLAGLRWLRAVNDSYTESGSAENLAIDRRGVNS